MPLIFSRIPNPNTDPHTYPSTQYVLMDAVHLEFTESLEFKKSDVFPKRPLSHTAVENDRPIIGILAQISPKKTTQGPTYIAASYVKFIEAAGARVVPIMVNDVTEDYWKNMFASVNGLLLPGGGVDLNNSGYANASRVFYKLAIEAAGKGDYFPIWGTCMGFEMLVTITANDNVLTKTDSANLSLPLNFTKGFSSSRMFADVSLDALTTLANRDVTFNFHRWSLTPAMFVETGLDKFYQILTINTDRKGVEFISTIEAYDYPIYAVQWHPEKNLFEWNTHEPIDHTGAGMRAVHYFANFIVSEARRNTHKFQSLAEETQSLIYQFTPVYTGDIINFEQCYFF